MWEPKEIIGRGWAGLPLFSKSMYEDTYFLPNENYDGWVTRVSTAYQNDEAHGKRMGIYIKNKWFHPSTPPSSNAGTISVRDGVVYYRGLPISCFTKKVFDNKKSIFSNYNEAFNLGAQGGGIGSTWQDVREIGHAVGQFGGKTGGIIPLMGISDAATNGISQGGLRRASEAVYIDISHPEIEEFIDLRKPTGDQTRRCPNLHHGINISDAFMHAMIKDEDWDLISPKDGKVVKTVKAKKLWKQILEVRQTLKGEPFLIFIDNVNNALPPEYVMEGIKVETSNLCTEITLRTDEKHSGVCCLSSINLEYYDEYAPNIQQFISDCLDYLDNMLQSFIDLTEGVEGFERARAGAIDERSIGLGVMGYHSYLQSKNIPFESGLAKGANIKIFRTLREASDYHNSAVNKPCPMSIRCGTNRRNIHMWAIAPTMSISNLCDITSSGIEPWLTNTFVKKLKQGTVAIKNKYLDRLITETARSLGHDNDWIDDQWSSIKANNGSVAHLEWMDQWEKDVYKTAYEINQEWIVRKAADRQPFICQGQSTNLFFAGGSNTKVISDVHIAAWYYGNKSLYYLRSSAIFRASTQSNVRKVITTDSGESIEEQMKPTCLGCE